MLLKNEHLSVEIDALGAELSSIKDKRGNEYLWQGSDTYWRSRAINLFPFVGALYQGTYTYQGKEYHINQHGFLRHTVLKETIIDDSKGFFSMQESPETKEVYPFSFSLEIHYQLTDNQLSITYLIKNTDTKEMYFGFGGHPGFNIPFNKGESFDDYQVNFVDAKETKRVSYSPENLPIGSSKEYSLKNGTIQPLSHSLFDNGIVLLENSGHKAILSHKEKETPSITLEYPDCPYLGLWHTPQSDAPFVCLEPWAALPGRDQTLEDLETKPDTIHLAPGQQYQNRLILTID